METLVKNGMIANKRQKLFILSCICESERNTISNLELGLYFKTAHISYIIVMRVLPLLYDSSFILFFLTFVEV